MPHNETNSASNHVHHKVNQAQSVIYRHLWRLLLDASPGISQRPHASLKAKETKENRS